MPCERTPTTIVCYDSKQSVRNQASSVESLLIRENHNGGHIDYKDENILQEYLHVVDMWQIILIWSQYKLNSFKGFNECANYLSSQLST